MDPEQIDAEQMDRFRAQIELLEKTWSTEERDPEWSQMATASLGQNYSAEEFAGIEAKSDCRWSMCRVDLRFADGQNIELLGRRAGSAFPWPAHAFFNIDSESRTGIYYVARENYELPVMAVQ